MYKINNTYIIILQRTMLIIYFVTIMDGISMIVSVARAISVEKQYFEEILNKPLKRLAYKC